MKRAIFYIDGFNLYHGIRDTKQQFLKWLDIQKLSEVILRVDARDMGVYANLSVVNFFTANLTGSKKTTGKGVSPGEDKIKRQLVYLRAVRLLNKTRVISGHFVSKTIWCPNCKSYHGAYEEKRTDVNIASELLLDAYEDRFDFAYVVSGDSDLVRPIQIVAAMNKRVVVVSPPNRDSNDLIDVANGNIRLTAERLEKCVFPYKIVTRKRKHIYMLGKWAEDAPPHIIGEK